MDVVFVLCVVMGMMVYFYFLEQGTAIDPAEEAEEVEGRHAGVGPSREHRGPHDRVLMALRYRRIRQASLQVRRVCLRYRNGRPHTRQVGVTVTGFVTVTGRGSSGVLTDEGLRRPGARDPAGRGP